MATASTKFSSKMCHTCIPKQTIAITSCHGCQCHFCRKHFNEHRDQLSEDLNTIVDLHDQILQGLKTRINHSPKKQLTNNEIGKLLRQIDEWEEVTITECHRTADEVRASVKQLFDKTKENNSLTERLSFVAKELEEQQQIENFVERDLERWKKQLEELKNDINRPIKFPAGVMIERRDIDWKKSIKINQTFNANTSVEQYVLVGGDKGVGKTTFIHYIANFFENKRSFKDRIPQESLETYQKEVSVSKTSANNKFLSNRYSFPIDDQTTLVFLDPFCRIDEMNKYMTVDSYKDLHEINRFAAVVFIIDGTDIEENSDVNDLVNHSSVISEKLIQRIDEYGQVAFVFTNCSPHALNFDRSALDISDKVSAHFMQNSAYQLFRASSTTKSVETDYRKAMETMQQIVNKIVDGIYRRR